MKLSSKGWKQRWPARMALHRKKIPVSYRARFRRFLEWLTKNGIADPRPADLRPEQLERYSETLIGTRLRTRAAYLFGAVRGAQIVAPWLDLGPMRRHAQSLLNSGQNRTKKGRSTTQGTKATKSIPLRNWPVGHRKAWESALSAMKAICGEGEEDSFDHYADPEKLPAFSRNDHVRRNCVHAWGRWLWVMKQENESWELTPRRIDKFIESCLADGCSHGGVVSYLSLILFIIRIVAPKTDQLIIDVLRETRDAEKERHGLPVPTQIVHASELARAGLKLMRSADAQPLSSRAAIEYRDGLLMWLGTVIPARSINLGDLRIGRNLFLDDEPRIVWREREIKGGIECSYPLPEKVADRMRRMMERYRPMLMGENAERQDWFFGPRRGGSGENRGLTTSRINEIIAKRSSELCTKRVTGHSRRHSVATMFTEEAPEHIGHVTTLLQQRNERSRSFYNRRATKVLASRLSAQGLAELRKSLEK
jgi:hypothetical protein